MDTFMWGGTGDSIFNIIFVIIVIGFIFIFGTFMVSFVQGSMQWHSNNEAPVLTVDATVVTKREDVHQYHHNTGDVDLGIRSSLNTTYYVTFQVASGDRMEFEVHDDEYGMLVENDMGKLTFQGTRYLKFERIM